MLKKNTNSYNSGQKSVYKCKTVRWANHTFVSFLCVLHRFMSPAQADMLFLENAMGLPMYGVDLHPAKVILNCQLNSV